MATTKTIQPTGATITIPDFTEKPDIRVINTDISNITDAANALSDQIAQVDTLNLSTETGVTIDDGGAFRYGKIIVIYMKVTLTQTITGNAISGLPNPKGTNASIIDVGDGFSVSNYGTIRCALNAGTYYLHGCYVEA